MDDLAGIAVVLGTGQYAVGRAGAEESDADHQRPGEVPCVALGKGKRHLAISCLAAGTIPARQATDVSLRTLQSPLRQPCREAARQGRSGPFTG